MRTKHYLAILFSLLTLIALVACSSSESTDESSSSGGATAASSQSDKPKTDNRMPAPKPLQTKSVIVSGAISNVSGGGKGALKVAMKTLGNAQGLPGVASGGTGDTIPGMIGLMEKMVERKASDLSYKPHLAASYEVASDMSNIIINVRKGVKWHHGFGELTAHDFVFSQNDAGLDNPDSTYGNLGYIHQYQDTNEAVDDYTVKMNIKQFSILYEPVIIGQTFMYSKQAYDEKGRDWTITNPVGTGPFEMESWTPNDEFVANTFVDYWDGAASFGQLSVKEVPEDATRVALLKTRAIHVMDPVPFSFMSELLDDGFAANNDNQAGATQALTYSGNFWMPTYPKEGAGPEGTDVTPRSGFEPDDAHPWIGTGPDDESARLVRHGLSMMIDRQLMVDEILLGQGYPEYINFFSSSLPEHKDEWKVDYNPEEGHNLLEQAGHPASEFPAFEIYVQQLPNVNFDVFDALATMWINEGIDVTVNKTAYQAFRPSLVDRSWNGPTSCCACPCVGPLALYDEPRLAAKEGSTIGEGDWNPGYEVYEVINAANDVEANPLDRDARVAANLKLGDFFHHQMLSTGIVHANNPVWYDPNSISGWSQEISGGFNSLETITLLTEGFENEQKRFRGTMQKEECKPTAATKCE